MLKKVSAFLLACALLLCLCACQGGETTSTTTAPPSETTTAPATETTAPAQTTTAPADEVVYDHTDTSIFQLKKWYKEIPQAALVGVTEDGKEFQLPPTEDNYRVMQGICTDRTYLYALLEKKNQDVNGEKRSLCRMAKIDLSTWELLGYSEPLEVDHGNGMTYNTKTGEILVANYSDYPKRISVIDSETMTLTRTVELNRAARGIAYNEEKDCYAVASSSYGFAIYDADFNELAYYEGNAPSSGKKCFGRQSISFDGEYIYMTYTGAVINGLNGWEIVCCYDWSGNFCGVFSIRTFYEIESTVHVDGVTYAAFYNDGGKFFRVEFDKELLKDPAE